MTQTQNDMRTFKTGLTYQMTFIGDSNLKVPFTCVKRTAKTVTFNKVNSKEIITRRIKSWYGVEYVLDGSYSMAPSIYADKVV